MENSENKKKKLQQFAKFISPMWSSIYVTASSGTQAEWPGLCIASGGRKKLSFLVFVSLSKIAWFEEVKFFKEHSILIFLSLFLI